MCSHPKSTKGITEYGVTDTTKKEHNSLKISCHKEICNTQNFRNTPSLFVGVISNFKVKVVHICIYLEKVRMELSKTDEIKLLIHHLRIRPRL